MNGAARNFKMVVSYDGTQYAGWQVQVRRTTIQGMLEKAIAQVARERVRVTGSGRTDSGVHAIGQVASFSLSRWRAGAAELARALNSKLPPDISILSIADAPAEFHAIRDAVGKRYRYQLRIGGTRHAFDYRYRWHVPGPLCIDAMRQAASLLVGRHDFASFQAAGSDRKTTVRHVRDLIVVDQDFDRCDCDVDMPAGGQGRAGGQKFSAGDSAGIAGHRIAIEIEADGFLYNMVRNIVGTLVEVGRGKQSVEWVSDVLDRRDRTVAGPTAPPHGLFLLRVDYPGDDTVRGTEATEQCE